MKHYMKPVLKIDKKDNESVYYHSTQCVDELFLYIEMEGNTFKDVKWFGQGCAVFQSSTDLFLLSIIDKDINHVQTLIESYESLIDRVGSYDEKLLGDLMIYFNVNEHLNRATCAKMVIEALKKFIKNNNSN